MNGFRVLKAIFRLFSFTLALLSRRTEILVRLCSFLYYFSVYVNFSKNSFFCRSLSLPFPLAFAWGFVRSRKRMQRYDFLHYPPNNPARNLQKILVFNSYLHFETRFCRFHINIYRQKIRVCVRTQCPKIHDGITDWKDFSGKRTGEGMKKAEEKRRKGKKQGDRQGDCK